MSTVDAVVIGAGGPTGRLCVEKLLSENKTVRAVVRNPDKYKDVWQSSEKLSIVKGDITDEESLLPALEGAKGVIVSSAASTYFSSDAVEHEVRLTSSPGTSENHEHVSAWAEFDARNPMAIVRSSKGCEGGEEDEQ